MQNLAISNEIMEYMVWIVEIASNRFFKKDKTFAYNTLVKSGIWNLYVENYEVTHTLCADFILAEIKELLIAKGELTC